VNLKVADCFRTATDQFFGLTPRVKKRSFPVITCQQKSSILISEQAVIIVGLITFDKSLSPPAFCLVEVKAMP
jgi:hypothetical protein